MGVSITAQQQHLEKQHAGRPYTRTATKPGKNELPNDGLHLEEQEGACKNCQGKCRHG
ncbi:hypothetical protein SDC9_201189 [bioreactor metagenome]|uniref:Uncharacterized protein n=1 Tax=bioreactor metagenome TaxID=1076179 RepID=A0A645IQ88_9ZZZZ